MGIKVENLSHVYHEGLPHQTLALDNISFTIKKGEFVALIGHTGSGKSTLVQHLNGLLKPSSGTIVIGDQCISQPGYSMREIRRRVGLVFQYPEYQLFEETVEKDVAFGPINLGLTKEEVARRVDKALNLVDLSPEIFGGRSPFELSGGQKRRVAIAGVIAMEPEILILDEPTAGLDPKAHQQILSMISEIHRERQGITLLVSHNMGDVARLSQKVLVMENGRLAMEGSPLEVFESMGLGLPPISQAMGTLKDLGCRVETQVYSLEDAEKEILRFIGGAV